MLQHAFWINRLIYMKLFWSFGLRLSIYVHAYRIYKCLIFHFVFGTHLGLNNYFIAEQNSFPSNSQSSMFTWTVCSLRNIGNGIHTIQHEFSFSFPLCFHGIHLKEYFGFLQLLCNGGLDMNSNHIEYSLWCCFASKLVLTFFNLPSISLLGKWTHELKILFFCSIDMLISLSLMVDFVFWSWAACRFWKFKVKMW